MTNYIHRHAENQFHLLNDIMRVVFVSGPRQCGKTTLMKNELRGRAEFITLDQEEYLEQAKESPAEFLADALKPFGRVAIDEVQKAPSLFGQIKYEVDCANQPGQINISGSSNYRALPMVNESLAGRLGEVRLRTFTQAELHGKKRSFIDQVIEQDFGEAVTPDKCSKALIIEYALAGGYPEICQKAPRVRAVWFRNYLKSLFERDLQDIKNFRKPSALEKISERMAALSGRTLNFAEMARDLQEDQRLVKEYIQALKTMYLFDEVPPWSEKIHSRMQKLSKWYVTDSGLMSAMMKFHDPKDFVRWAEKSGKQGSDLVGNLIETFAYTQLAPLVDADDVWRLYHLRFSEDQEIDFLLENERGSLIAIEVKARETVRSDDFKHLRWLKDRLPDREVYGVVLYCGQKVRSYGENLTAVPMAKFWC